MFARLKHVIKVCSVLLIFAPYARPALAVDATPSPSATPRLLDAIVVTAQRHPAKIRNSPRQTFVLYTPDLVRLGAQTVADALRFVPGTVVQQYGVLGALATVALRGTSTAETLVLIDGRPANESDTGTFDFSSLPAAAVERVEIVEGGSSTLYGSAAVGGVINIITRRPSGQPRANAFLEAGYQGAFNRGLGFSLGDQERFAVRVDAQSEAANNVFDYPALDQTASAGTRNNDDTTLKHTAVTLSDYAGRVHSVLSLSDDASAIGAPGATGPFASKYARELRVYQRLALDMEAPLASGQVALQLYSDGKRLRFYDLSIPFDTQSNGAGRGASLRVTRSVGRLQVVTAGWETRADDGLFNAGIPGQAPSVVHAARTAWFAQDELQRARAPFALTLGLRHENIQGTQATTVPSVGVLQRVSSRLDVIANYARAFRAPSLDERYYPFYGNPHLQPEYAATFDAGLRAELPNGAASVSLFGSDTNNLIVNVPIDQFGDLAPYNVNRAHVRGLAWSAQNAFGHQLHASLSYTAFLAAADRAPGRGDTRLQYRPTADGAISLWREQPGWNYGLQGAFVGRRFADEANRQLLRPYFLTSVYVARMLGAHARFTVRLDNLENNRLAEDELGYPVIGRSLSLRLATQ